MNQAGFAHKLLLTLKMIKIQHSVFALPFALASALVATGGELGLKQLTLIILAMVTARNTAMSFNRIVDRHIDAQNPRTKNREIPSGQLSLGFSTGFCTINALLFVALASLFNPLTFYLSPVALIIVCGYSLTKRFTHYTQVFLGFALGSSPLAAWIALTGTLETFPILLGCAVWCWVAGFDIIYSSLDHNFDKAQGLKNLVVKWGIKRALLISRGLHVLAVGLFFTAGLIKDLGTIHHIGCTLMALALVYEHSLVKPTDLSRVNMAFFTVNGYIALGYLLCVGASVLI